MPDLSKDIQGHSSLGLQIRPGSSLVQRSSISSSVRESNILSPGNSTSSGISLSDELLLIDLYVWCIETESVKFLMYYLYM